MVRGSPTRSPARSGATRATDAEPLRSRLLAHDAGERPPAPRPGGPFILAGCVSEAGRGHRRRAPSRLPASARRRRHAGLARTAASCARCCATGASRTRGCTSARPKRAACRAPRVELLPQLVVPGADGALEARTDSTPLIRQLEALHAGPLRDPARSASSRSSTRCSRTTPTSGSPRRCSTTAGRIAPDVAQAAGDPAALVRAPISRRTRRGALGRVFAERQIGRLGVVGSNATTAPVIEESYRRLLALLDAHLTASRFVMGGRPGAADFALYGQLTQLAGFDPTPRGDRARDGAARRRLGRRGRGPLRSRAARRATGSRRDAVPATLRALLAEVGRVYVPFLLANADALARGAERVECTIDGRPWVQRPFPYQAQVSRAGCARRRRRARARRPAARVDALPRRHGLRGAVRGMRTSMTVRAPSSCCRSRSSLVCVWACRDGDPELHAPGLVARLRDPIGPPHAVTLGRGPERAGGPAGRPAAEHRRDRRRRPRLQRPHVRRRRRRRRRRADAAHRLDRARRRPVRRPATPATRPARRRARRS